MAQGTKAGRRATVGAVGAAVLAVAALGACASKSSGPGSGISVDAVHTAAAKLGSGGGACPLGLDVDAALKAAGAAGTAAPNTADGQPAADGITPENADGGSPAKQYGFSLIECSYVITDGGTTTDLGVRLGALPSGKGDVIANLLGPVLARDGKITAADLRTFLGTTFSAGQSKVTPGAGTAVYSQLSGSGSGVGLEVGAAPGSGDGSTPTPPGLSGAGLQKLTTTLAGQIHL